MIQLFNIPTHIVDTSKYSNLLHDSIVLEFEREIADYVGAKYACAVNSATTAIFLTLLNKNVIVRVPSNIPPVVLNAICTSGNNYKFIDNPFWVGDSYILHTFSSYKIVDSAQKLERNQFKSECNDKDLMIFSFYPTKPVGSCDGGMIVSNDFNKIKALKELSFNGMSYSENNWDRKILFPGYKMYMNSIQADIGSRNFKLYPDKLIKLSELRDKYNNVFNLKNTSNHLYRINVNNRDVFIQHMKLDGIICGIHYEAMHLHPVYKNDIKTLPFTEYNSNTTVSIPFHENLSESDVQYIIKKILEYATF